MMKRLLKKFFTKNNGFCFISAGLLILSFPKIDLWIFAWVGLAPLMLALDRQTLKSSFMLGCWTGILFFAAMIYWFIFVTSIGMVLLVLYCAIYFGLFGIGYFYFSRCGLWKKIFLIPALWVALEFIRSHLFSGFGWVLLGHSQYKNLFFIQIADTVGVYGISFLVMMANVLLKEIFVGLSQTNRRTFFKEMIYSAVAVFALVGLTIFYGMFRLHQQDGLKNSSAVISVVQANIPNEYRWHARGWPLILQEHLDLTVQAARENPDLIVWPETAFPGYHWEDDDLLERLKKAIRDTGIASLVGIVTKEKDQYFNAAFLFSPLGVIQSRYYKIHLVPFGEYIPLRNIFPFLSFIVPIDDFTSGKDYTLFPLGQEKDPQKYFSVLICFEDTMPRLAREFTRQGTNLFVNMTNDDWFQDTKAPFLHLQASIFRSVENRRPLVRAANTGVSGFVDTRGRITLMLSDKNHKYTYIKGILTQKVFFSSEKTLYTKYGDIFAYFCFGVILIEVLMVFYKQRKKFSVQEI